MHFNGHGARHKAVLTVNDASVAGACALLALEADACA